MFSPDTFTLDEFFTNWFSVKRGIRPSTRQNYENIYKNRIGPRLGKTGICKLTLLNVKRFYIYLSEELNFSPITIKTTHVLLNQILDGAVAEHLIRDNPAKLAFKEFKSLSEKNSSKKHALTKEEQTALLSFVSGNGYYKKWYNMIIVFLGTGLRAGELSGLSWDDIDFERDTLTVSKTLTYYNNPKDGGLKFRFQAPKTSCGKRIIPLSPSVKNALLSEKKVQDEKHLCGKLSVNGINNFCFLTHFERPYPVSVINNALLNIVKSYNKSAELIPDMVKLPHISCHTFRHSFATRMFEAGVEPKVIQEILGHSSISITMDIYTNVFNSLKKRDIEAVDAFLST